MMETFNPFRMKGDPYEWFLTNTVPLYRFFKKNLSTRDGKILAFNALRYTYENLVKEWIELQDFKDHEKEFLKKSAYQIFRGRNEDDELDPEFNQISDLFSRDFFKKNPLEKKNFLEKNKPLTGELLANTLDFLTPEKFISLITASTAHEYIRMNNNITRDEEKFARDYLKYLIIKSGNGLKREHYFQETEYNREQIIKTLKYFFFVNSPNSSSYYKAESYRKFTDYALTFFQDYSGFNFIPDDPGDIIFLSMLLPEPRENEEMEIRDGIIISNHPTTNFWKKNPQRYCMNIYCKETKHVYGFIYKIKTDQDNINYCLIGSEIQTEGIIIKRENANEYKKNNLIIDLLRTEVIYFV